MSQPHARFVSQAGIKDGGASTASLWTRGSHVCRCSRADELELESVWSPREAFLGQREAAVADKSVRRVAEPVTPYPPIARWRGESCFVHQNVSQVENVKDAGHWPRNVLEMQPALLGSGTT